MPTDTGTSGREERIRDAAVLSFDLTDEAQRLHGEARWSEHGHNAVTLLKAPRLRVVLEAMQTGRKMHVPHADGPITLLPLSGRVVLRAGDIVQEAGPSCLLALQPRIEHEVEALENSVVILTIAFEGHGA